LPSRPAPKALTLPPLGLGSLTLIFGCPIGGPPPSFPSRLAARLLTPPVLGGSFTAILGWGAPPPPILPSRF